MALTIDWPNKVIESSSSITDLPAWHAEMRDAEDSAIGMLYPVTHTWKALDLGSGAFFYQADLINGWRLKFPSAGNYTIKGNLKGKGNVAYSWGQHSSEHAKAEPFPDWMEIALKALLFYLLVHLGSCSVEETSAAVCANPRTTQHMQQV